jgi:hypothetical protein
MSSSPTAADRIVAAQVGLEAPADAAVAEPGSRLIAAILDARVRKKTKLPTRGLVSAMVELVSA